MRLFSLLTILFSLISGTAWCADSMWAGELYNITPKVSNVTEDYCKQHALDMYENNPTLVHKEVTSKNGVQARNIRQSISESGGIYFVKGSALFSGTYDDKPWKEKVYFAGMRLKKDGMERGAWYTKDCKGFYKVGPASDMD